MASLYVYDPDSRKVIAVISGDPRDCERVAADQYGDTDYYLTTYAPAFGSSDGLIDSGDAEEILA